MTVNSSPLRPAEDRTRVWFGISVGPAAWTAHLLLSYLVVSNGCPLGAGPLKAVLFAISAVCAALAALGALAAWRTWKEWTGNEPPENDKHHRRVGFMGFSGVILSGYFVLAIVVESIPILMLEVCE